MTLPKITFTRPTFSWAATKAKLLAVKRFFVQLVTVWAWHVLSFIGLLFVYLVYHTMLWLAGLRFTPAPVKAFLIQQTKRIMTILNQWTRREEKTINRLNLIDLAMRNLRFKRSRSLITVGGMAIGISIIVFLVSIGFGLQRMVVSRVARLDELKQADVSTQPGGNIPINDEAISKIKANSNVEAVLPMIATVSRISYQNSVSDVAVYGVTAAYLHNSAIQPSRGKIFTSDEIAMQLHTGAVAGVADSADQLASEDVYFALPEEEWFKVRSEPARGGELLGYTRALDGEQQGVRVAGENFVEAAELDDPRYQDQGQGPWIQAQYRLWDKTNCDLTAANCIDGYEIKRASTGEQLSESGYVAQRFNSVRVKGQNIIGEVLGETDVAVEDATETASASADVFGGIVEDGEWVELASENAGTITSAVEKVSLSSSAYREAVVNRAMLQLLGISEDDAVGKTFNTSFVLSADLTGNPDKKIESTESEYTIVGVIPTDDAAYFYVPFIDLRSLGVTAYSQLKVVAKNPDDLEQIRKQIENFGFATSSVTDTVKQIDQLFASVRVVLVVVGMVALSIAALGMFNTLTVSLLERTREVGLMKAMGMKSHEVQELFLTESLVMGFFGGLGGIFLGWLLGNGLSFILSIFSVSRGIGIVDVSYLPPSFITFIFVLSMIVGIFTGVYPARRATKISALNALRYE